MSTKKSRLFALLVCLTMFLASQVQAQDTDDLQKLIDRVASAPITRAEETVREIDLSPYTEPRTATLYIRNGANVRFVNGTLTRTPSLKDPLVEIKDDSRLEVSETASLIDYRGDGASSFVNVIDGILEISGGMVESEIWTQGTPGPLVLLLVRHLQLFL